MQFTHIDMFEDPNDALGVWYSFFLDVVNDHAPLKQKRVKRQWQPEWYTADIKECRYQRDELKRKGDT